MVLKNSLSDFQVQGVKFIVGIKKGYESSGRHSDTGIFSRHHTPMVLPDIFDITKFVKYRFDIAKSIIGASIVDDQGFPIGFCL